MADPTRETWTIMCHAAFQHRQTQEGKRLRRMQYLTQDNALAAFPQFRYNKDATDKNKCDLLELWDRTTQDGTPLKDEAA